MTSYSAELYRRSCSSIIFQMRRRPLFKKYRLRHRRKQLTRPLLVCFLWAGFGSTLNAQDGSTVQDQSSMSHPEEMSSHKGTSMPAMNMVEMNPASMFLMKLRRERQ